LSVSTRFLACVSVEDGRMLGYLSPQKPPLQRPFPPHAEVGALSDDSRARDDCDREVQLPQLPPNDASGLLVGFL